MPTHLTRTDPRERAHCAVANSIRAMLLGANLDIKFWPYATHHYLRFKNVLPSRDQVTSPSKLATNNFDDFSGFRTFGCRVWIRPPGRRSAKFRMNSRKGIFLGFLPNTTSNILWYDAETNRVKIAKHARFDEGVYDLPFHSSPPNVQHLTRLPQGEPVPMEAAESSIDEWHFVSNPVSTPCPRSLMLPLMATTRLLASTLPPTNCTIALTSPTLLIKAVRRKCSRLVKRLAIRFVELTLSALTVSESYHGGRYSCSPTAVQG